MGERRQQKDGKCDQASGLEAFKGRRSQEVISIIIFGAEPQRIADCALCD